VTALIVRAHHEFGAMLESAARSFRCAIGRSGIGDKQREGDGITPIGDFAIHYVFYRPDKLAPPQTNLPLRPIEASDGWCDAPDDPSYNRLVALPYSASAERMWRDDDLYDVVAVLGFNDDPVVPNAGSAIFLHVARPDYAPTEGCVALALPDLLSVLRDLKPGATVSIRR
jgi:L,D-peptidoglycan transpeptidase YkuD (ErfK/YbiS/YcfS/YnhG family)